MPRIFVFVVGFLIFSLVSVQKPCQYLVLSLIFIAYDLFSRLLKKVKNVYARVGFLFKPFFKKSSPDLRVPRRSPSRLY